MLHETTADARGITSTPSHAQARSYRSAHEKCVDDFDDSDEQCYGAPVNRRAPDADAERQLRSLGAELADERPDVAERLEAVSDRLRDQAALEPGGYVTTGEAARALGVSPNTVKKWVRLGYITDVWALPGSGYLKIARSEIERIRMAGAPSQEKKG